MPHSKQAKKRLRQDDRKKLINRSMKSTVRTSVKKVLKAVDTQELAAAKEALPKAMKKLDKAAKRNVIHKNQAARRISKLARKVNALEAKPPESAEK